MMKRISGIILIVALLCGQNCRADEVGRVFSFNDVIVKARLLSEREYREEKSELPEKLEKMDYDDFRSLRYVREKGPWFSKNIPFEIQFFHMGSIFKNAVKVNEIVGSQVRKIPYDFRAFTLNDQPLYEINEDINYAGFRLHYPLNTSDYYDELITFLGASYFRALGQNQKYGLSARGLAIDTGLQSGEEFPFFKEFWIKRPMQRVRNITVYALLDSPRITGAYSFFIRPGLTTKIDVSAVLFPREKIQKVGIAPLTSMYLFGENTKNKFFDYRPEVHDSDGLLIHNGADEWLWRPLDNSRHLRISSFEDQNVLGFGLFQRDRNADHYQDFEAHYQDRPSVWVEPLSPFGQGVVELVEIPSDKEIHDNVVAFFVPKQPFEKGKEYRFNYRLYWMKDENPVSSELGEVVSTYSGIGGVSGVGDEETIKFVIDFKGKALDNVKQDQSLVPVVETSVGKIKNIVMTKNPFIDGYRLFFDYKPDGKTAELRAFIRNKTDNLNLTEVWSYQYLP